MKFVDHIMAYVEKGAFDFASAWAELAFYVKMFRATPLASPAFEPAAKLVTRQIKALLHAKFQAYRYHLKCQMLRTPDWRQRVIEELGGITALLDWYKKPPPLIGKNRKTRVRLSRDEVRRRAHIRACAEATASPNIHRDPFRVDQDGQFRLAPRGRLISPKSKNENCQRDYTYDARPFTKLTGLNTPISIWPDEVFVFMEIEAEPTPPKRGVCKAHIKTWLSHLAQTVEPLPLAVTEAAILKPP